MTDEKLWLLVSLQFSGEATPAETEELAMLTAQDHQLAERAAVMERIWKARSGTAAAMPFDKHLERMANAPVLQFEEPVQHAMLSKGKTGIERKWWWIAGTVAASLLLLVWTYHPDKKDVLSARVAANTITTKPGSKSKIELPDGTQVWLNADSKLEYRGDFSGKLREVNLSGEAYFDVVKDKSRPFIIHTSTVQVKVLGTAFNVRSYPSGRTTETALIRGSVEVTLNGQPDKKVILKPNEKLVIDNAPVQMSAAGNSAKVNTKEAMLVSAVHLDKKDQEVYETMWVKNKLAFDETPFDDMIADIERWYNVSIVVKNKALSAGTYTVTFENKTLDEVLEGLQFSAHFQYQLKDGVVTIQ